MPGTEIGSESRAGSGRGFVQAAGTYAKGAGEFSWGTLRSDGHFVQVTLGALWKLGRKGARLEVEGLEADKTAKMGEGLGLEDICNPI